MNVEKIYEVTQLDDSSWIINEDGARMFLFAGTDKALLVDSGWGRVNLKETINGLTQLPVMLVNTHADIDHIGNNAMFDKVYMHPSDFFRYRLSDGPKPALGALRDGAIIDLGVRSFQVIHLPGHTPGSIMLLDAKNRVLIAGDSIMDDRIFMTGPARDMEAYVDSMEKLYDMRDSFETVYTSHGTFPLKADILGGLISGAKRILEGAIKGEEVTYEEGARAYDVGVAKFVLPESFKPNS